MREALLLAVLLAGCGRTASFGEAVDVDGWVLTIERAELREATVWPAWPPSTAVDVTCDAPDGGSVRTPVVRGTQPGWATDACVLRRGEGFSFQLLAVETDGALRAVGTRGAFVPSEDDLAAGHVVGQLAHTPFYELFVSFREVP